MVWFKKVFLICFLSVSLFAMDDWPKEISFVIAPVAGVKNRQTHFEPLIKYLEKSLNVKINAKFVDTNISLVQSLKNKPIDVIYVDPKYYIDITEESNNMEAIAVDVDIKSGLSTFKSIIIVKKDSNINTIKDLENKKFTFTTTYSISGLFEPLLMFKDKNIVLEKFFSNVKYSGSQFSSILAVKQGLVDAASVNNLDFENGDNNLWKKDDFKIIWKSNEISGAPIAVNKDLPKLFRLALKGAILEYQDNNSKFKSYANGYDEYYDDAREIMNKAKKIDN